MPASSTWLRSRGLRGSGTTLFAANLSLFAGSAFFAAYKDKLIRRGFEFVAADEYFATPFPDDTWLDVNRDVGGTAERIPEFSSADAAHWRSMVQQFSSEPTSNLWPIRISVWYLAKVAPTRSSPPWSLA
jgi:phytoene dehydrogenase-like protein